MKIAVTGGSGGIGRAITEMGMALVPPGPTGMANGINFQPTGGGKAAITGDFVLTGEMTSLELKDKDSKPCQ